MVKKIPRIIDNSRPNVIYMHKCQQMPLIHSFLIETHPNFHLCVNNSRIWWPGNPNIPVSHCTAANNPSPG